MKTNEVTRAVKTWTSNEEATLLEKVTGLEPLGRFTEHDQVTITALVRKSLLIKVESKGVTFVYPNV